MDGSVLAVLAAYQNSLMTSQVVQCLFLQESTKSIFPAKVLTKLPKILNHGKFHSFETLLKKEPHLKQNILFFNPFTAYFLKKTHF